MKSKIFEGKVLDDIIQAAQHHFHHDRQKLTIEILEEKRGIFGIGASVTARVSLNIDPVEEGKKYLIQLLSDLQLTGTVQAQVEDKALIYNLSSSNNGAIIGKDGRTLQSIQTLLTQVVNQYTEKHMRVVVDVDSYRQKQIKRLESLARKVAKEVIQTKIDVKLDPMNAYERRIIHQALTGWNQVQTTSVGEEPQRYLVIKYKK